MPKVGPGLLTFRILLKSPEGFLVLILDVFMVLTGVFGPD
jgi:hypothetical protein